ncbi:hypothetical protein BH11CYA1_BH11CYA1_38780 [soil metagenome]
MLMLSDSFGHHAQHVDLAVFAAWLSLNHPDIFDGKGSLLAVDFHAMPPQVLDGALAHCRAHRVARASQGIRSVLERESPFMLHYADAGWSAPVGGHCW